MPDYSKGKIYKIVSDDPNITEVYIGSTTMPLYNRWSKHKSDFTAGVFVSSALLFEKYGFEPFKIELIENYPCTCEKELKMREQYYIDTVNCVNVSKSYRTEEQKIEYYKQYSEDNKDKLTEYHKIYYGKNKNTLLSKNKAYRNENIEAVKAQKKVYTALNSEKKSAYDKERRKIRWVCHCGIEIALADKSNHIKTKRHIDLMANLHLE